MSGEQPPNLTEAYGQAILYGYLIEDVLQLHLFECSHYHVNGYQGNSKTRIRDMNFARLIREFRLVYVKQGKFADGLDKIRLIRNKLAHAWVDQIGSDLETDEGYDQIHASYTARGSTRVSIFEELEENSRRVIHGGCEAES